MLSRRGFVAASGSIALVVGSGSTAAVLGLQSSKSEAQSFSRAEFANLLDTQFNGSTDAGSYSMRLVAIEDGPVSPGTEQFSLLFESSSTDLPDGNYRLGFEIDGQYREQLLHLNTTSDDRPANIYVANFSLLA